MTVTEPPVLDLSPILGGDGQTSVVVTQENMRRIMEWAVLVLQYIEVLDGGGP